MTLNGRIHHLEQAREAAQAYRLATDRAREQAHSFDFDAYTRRFNEADAADPNFFDVMLRGFRELMNGDADAAQ